MIVVLFLPASTQVTLLDEPTHIIRKVIATQCHAHYDTVEWHNSGYITISDESSESGSANIKSI